MRKILLFTLMCLLLTFSVAAESTVLENLREYTSDSFDVTVEVVDNDVKVSDAAKFDITITNNGDAIEYVGLTFQEADSWKWVRTNPIYYGTTETQVYPASPATFQIVLDPKADMSIGSHILKATFKARNGGDSIDVPLDVYIQHDVNVKYSPDLKASIDFDEEIDPRNDNIIKVNIENLNARDYPEESITLVVESDLLGSEKMLIGIAGKTSDEEVNKIINVQFDLERDQLPVRDSISAHYIIDGQRFEIAAFNYEVVDYTPKFQEEINSVSAILKKTSTLVYTNVGNNEKKQLVQIPTGFLSRFFTKVNPKSKIAKDVDGQRYFEWEVELAPNETFTVEMSKSYRALVYALLLVLILLVYNYMSQSPIIIRKEAHNVETSEGGISEMKVKLNILNTSSRPIDKIEVIDKVPNIVDVLQEFDVGTLKPNKVVKQPRHGSTLITWNLDEIDPHEERILSYKIKSKLSILGDFTLPVANVKYFKGKRKVVIYSNTVSVQG